MSSLDWTTATLKRRGLRVTPQRVAILRILHGLANHPSAEEVFRTVQRDFPSLSLTTVYRTLETLAELGEVGLVHVGGERVRFDHRTDPHHHAVCTACGQLADVEHREPGLADGLSIPFFGNERPRGNAVVFYGVCTGCRSPATA